MSLGEFSNNNNYNNNKKTYSPKVFSQYKMSNPESNVDATSFNPSFWNNMLVLSISPLKEVTDGKATYDHDNAASVYLSHTKARLLYDEICLFQQNPELYNNVGVDSGAGLIRLTNGKEFGVNSPLLVISKMDRNTGELVSSYAYHFKQDYHYTIRNFDQDTFEFDKIFNNNIEIEQLKTLLVQYYEAMSGAMAYSIVENMKYDMSRINTKLDKCAEGLGVEYKANNRSNSNKSSGSLFSNKEGRNFSSSTIDEIDELF